MKRHFVLILLLGLTINSLYAKDRGIQDYLQVIDSGYSYTWNKNSQSWTNTQRLVYKYNIFGRVTLRVSVNPLTNDSTSRIIYNYDQNKLIDYSFETKTAGKWEYYLKYLIGYNENGKMNSVVVLINKNGTLVNFSRSTKYFYNDAGLLEHYYGQVWNGFDWEDRNIEYYYYNEEGKIISSLSKSISGTINGRVLYSYNSAGQRTGFIAQSWDGVNNVFKDGYRDSYEYNLCGLLLGSLRERFLGGIWVNDSKEEYYYGLIFLEGNKQFKIPVCHNGHTIYVSRNALSAHLAHGDCIGECTIERENGRRDTLEKEKQEKPPFTIYPNPAKEKITIKFDNEECEELQRVELIDFYGKLIRSYNVKGNGDLTIYRDNLLSGKYMVRLIGKEVYSAVVIFK